MKRAWSFTNSKRALMAAMVVAGCLSTGAVWAQSSSSCDSGVASDLTTQATTNLVEQKARIDKAVADTSLDVEAPASGSTDSSATGLGALNVSCFSNVFGSLRSGFNIPTVDAILQGVGQAAINEACSALQSAVRNGTSSFSFSQTLHTGIPGFPTTSASIASANVPNTSMVATLMEQKSAPQSAAAKPSSSGSVLSGSARSLKNWLLGS